MAKGLKQARARASKGKGAEETASEGGLGKTPSGGPHCWQQAFSGLSPGSGRGLGAGVPYLLPLLTAHTEAPAFPTPGLT